MVRFAEAFVVALLASTGLAPASDGVLEINQACATSTAGCFPGDTAGFPVTISQPGSYRLTSSLTPSAASAITITVPEVTLDLNDFRVIASPAAPGINGISAAAQTDITVKNGLVKSFGGNGIQTGDRARIENVTARANIGAGIYVGAVSMVIACTAYGNGSAGTGDGISAGGASVVTGNTAVSNQGAGILVQASSKVSGNTANG